jgi:hypothetical protein
MPDNSVVVITAFNYEHYSIDCQMMDKGFLWRSDLMDSLSMWNLLRAWVFEKAMQFQGRHKGERCFIVGNGPSLRYEDLERLINETSFAMNYIYKIFEKTTWRPNYYLTTDRVVLRDHESIKLNIDCDMFFRLDVFLHLVEHGFDIDFDRAFYFSESCVAEERPRGYNKPPFGELPDLFYFGMTSTYACLQWAVFMGFSEIYLYGIDHQYSVVLNDIGELIFSDVENNFIKDYNKGNIIEKYFSNGFYATNFDRVNEGYQSAREYCDSRGIKIRNATHGGKLDVFERVDFDTLF